MGIAGSRSLSSLGFARLGRPRSEAPHAASSRSAHTCYWLCPARPFKAASYSATAAIMADFQIAVMNHLMLNAVSPAHALAVAVSVFESADRGGIVFAGDEGELRPVCKSGKYGGCNKNRSAHKDAEDAHRKASNTASSKYLDSAVREGHHGVWVHVERCHAAAVGSRRMNEDQERRGLCASLFCFT